MFTQTSITLGSMARDGQTGNKKHATCLATLPQNELNSVVVRFITHIKPVLQQIRLLTGLTDVGGETRTIIASFYASLSRSPVLIAFSRAFIPPFLIPIFSICKG